MQNADLFLVTKCKPNVEDFMVIPIGPHIYSSAPSKTAISRYWSSTHILWNIAQANILWNIAQARNNRNLLIPCFMICIRNVLLDQFFLLPFNQQAKLVQQMLKTLRIYQKTIIVLLRLKCFDSTHDHWQNTKHRTNVILFHYDFYYHKNK